MEILAGFLSSLSVVTFVTFVTVAEGTGVTIMMRAFLLSERCFCWSFLFGASSIDLFERFSSVTSLMDLLIAIMSFVATGASAIGALLMAVVTTVEITSRTVNL